nr:MAG TPA_asm: hypothetical protein [Bacteriophage sp.]
MKFNIRTQFKITKIIVHSLSHNNHIISIYIFILHNKLKSRTKIISNNNIY